MIGFRICFEGTTERILQEKEETRVESKILGLGDWDGAASH